MTWKSFMKTVFLHYNQLRHVEENKWKEARYPSTIRAMKRIENHATFCYHVQLVIFIARSLSKHFNGTLHCIVCSCFVWSELKMLMIKLKNFRCNLSGFFEIRENRNRYERYGQRLFNFHFVCIHMLQTFIKILITFYSSP